jgi:hypothetical protein
MAIRIPARIPPTEARIISYKYIVISIITTPSSPITYCCTISRNIGVLLDLISNTNKRTMVASSLSRPFPKRYRIIGPPTTTVSTMTDSHSGMIRSTAKISSVSNGSFTTVSASAITRLIAYKNTL